MSQPSEGLLRDLLVGEGWSPFRGPQIGGPTMKTPRPAARRCMTEIQTMGTLAALGGPVFVSFRTKLPNVHYTNASAPPARLPAAMKRRPSLDSFNTGYGKALDEYGSDLDLVRPWPGRAALVFCMSVPVRCGARRNLAPRPDVPGWPDISWLEAAPRRVAAPSPGGRS